MGMAAIGMYLLLSFLVSLVFIILGLRQYHAKKPVTISTGEKPPREEELTSVAEWNHRHGRNFIILGCAFFITLSIFAYFIETLEHLVFPVILLLLVLLAEIAWVAHAHRVMKKNMIIKIP